MKSLVAFLVALVGLVLWSAVVSAHPGGLDDKGGHHDRSDGTYHLHRTNWVGRVVSVYDGDTLTALCTNHAGRVQVKVRLKGIDAPEIGEPGAAAARQQLTTWTLNQVVTLECHGHDRYGRLLARVLLDNRDLCQALLDAELVREWQ